VTNLLLITDMSHLRKVFSRLSDETGIRLRIANTLEKGGEEIIAEKPDMVFVQTHLSGLSADIILMHLKKQLGRKRSRFVLLSPPEQATVEVLKLYQGHLDTSLDKDELLDHIREMVAGLPGKAKKEAPATGDPGISSSMLQITGTSEPAPPQPATAAADVPQPGATIQPEVPVPLVLQQIPESTEPSLEEQGVTYAPRPRLSVYSEFTSSFDSAVDSMQEPEPVTDSSPPPLHPWDHGDVETVEPGLTRSKRTTFLLWLAPVLVAVIAVTMLQHRKSNSTAEVAVPAKPPVAAAPANQAASAIPATGTKPPPATAPIPATKPVGQPPAASAPATIPAGQLPAAGANPQLSDKAIISAISENRGHSGQAGGTAAAPRPTALPNFIPRSGLDKGYGTANPGWERYKGEVTEFKVFREGSSIKAIQVIDRGGQGVPESFMKGVLKQVAKNPAFIKETSEKKEGYEILRGHVAENLKVVYYRDEKGGRLRAFVMTWQ